MHGDIVKYYAVNKKQEWKDILKSGVHNFCFFNIQPCYYGLWQPYFNSDVMAFVLRDCNVGPIRSCALADKVYMCSLPHCPLSIPIAGTNLCLHNYTQCSVQF